MASCLWVDEIINKGVGMAEGKEVYKSEEKQVRYDIVKTDFNSCPIKYRMPGKYKKHICFPFQRDCDKYGDTKEQLIKKVATAIFRREVKAYKKYYGIEPMRIITRDVETKCLKVAKEIVEFLGVE